MTFLTISEIIEILCRVRIAVAGKADRDTEFFKIWVLRKNFSKQVFFIKSTGRLQNYLVEEQFQIHLFW